jgi:hypothetical protein
MVENDAGVTRGVEMLLLIKDEGAWRTVSQAWDVETPSRRIPADLVTRAASGDLHVLPLKRPAGHPWLLQPVEAPRICPPRMRPRSSHHRVGSNNPAYSTSLTDGGRVPPRQECPCQSFSAGGATRPHMAARRRAREAFRAPADCEAMQVSASSVAVANALRRTPLNYSPRRLRRQLRGAGVTGQIRSRARSPRTIIAPA